MRQCQRLKTKGVTEERVKNDVRRWTREQPTGDPGFRKRLATSRKQPYTVWTIRTLESPRLTTSLTRERRMPTSTSRSPASARVVSWILVAVRALYAARWPSVVIASQALIQQRRCWTWPEENLTLKRLIGSSPPCRATGRSDAST